MSCRAHTRTHTHTFTHTRIHVVVGPLMLAGGGGGGRAIDAGMGDRKLRLRDELRLITSRHCAADDLVLCLWWWLSH